MSDRNTLVIRSERGRKGSRGVALHQHPVWPDFSDDTRKSQQQRGGQFGKGLTGLHDIEIAIDTEFERVQGLVEHFALLPGRADDGLEIAGAGAQRGDDGRELDALRPSPQCHHNSFSHSWPLRCAPRIRSKAADRRRVSARQQRSCGLGQT